VKAIIRKFEMEIKELREERDDLQKRVAVFESRAEQDYYMRHVEREMQPNGLAYITRKKDASCMRTPETFSNSARRTRAKTWPR
jgi:hypothetical protein